jgi:hypothetical protein
MIGLQPTLLQNENLNSIWWSGVGFPKDLGMWTKIIEL